MKQADLTSARILVVDDQQSNVMLLERLLEHWGYSDVTSTTDSSQVVSLCEQLQPDLLLLDLHMPQPDGFELLELLAPWIAGNGYLPIIVLTADVSHEAKQRALSTGAKDFLNKPLESNEVFLRVRNLLGPGTSTLSCSVTTRSWRTWCRCARAPSSNRGWRSSNDWRWQLSTGTMRHTSMPSALVAPPAWSLKGSGRRKKLCARSGERRRYTTSARSASPTPSC
jgi:CheY-like chemotaxis protein